MAIERWNTEKTGAGQNSLLREGIREEAHLWCCMRALLLAGLLSTSMDVVLVLVLVLMHACTVSFVVVCFLLCFAPRFSPTR